MTEDIIIMVYIVQSMEGVVLNTMTTITQVERESTPKIDMTDKKAQDPGLHRTKRVTMTD